jgi:hypothetical protein
MKVIQGDIWDYHALGHPVVITTNMQIKKDGTAVMGKGIALQAAQRFPDLPRQYAQILPQKEYAGVYYFGKYNLFTCPTKRHWRDNSDIYLIEESLCCIWLYITHHNTGLKLPIYLPPPGCGNGGLTWNEVQPKISRILDDRFVVCMKDQI